MWLFVGLGNPEDKYSHNRHNIGFMCIDSYLSHNSYSNITKSNFKSLAYKNNSNIFIKPQTYMNLSGQSVGLVSSYYKIEPQNIVVIHDDLDLEFGVIKYKIGGGHGGHNGLRSIDEHIGKNYIRIRVGIGRPKFKSDVSNYVLSDFSKKQFEFIQNLTSTIEKAIVDLPNHELKFIQSNHSTQAIIYE